MSVNKVNVSTTTQTQTTKTEKTEKKKNVFQKLGNWLSNHRTEIGLSMIGVGNAAVGVANNLAQYQLTKEMLRSGSIWGMGGGMYGAGMFGGGMYGGGMFDSFWMMNGDPLGLSWSGGGYNGYNSYYAQMGNQMAFNYGYQMAQQGAFSQGYAGNYNPNFGQIANNSQVVQNTATEPLKPEDNDFAEFEDIEEQDTEKGKEFDDATNSFVDKDGKTVSGKKFNLKVKANKDGEFSPDYREKVSEIGKSYLAHIEKTTGDVDKDGIDIDEFKKHEMAKLPDDATDAQKEEAEQRAENAFAKLDINNDQTIDWKEYSAAVMTFDQDAGTQPKGKTNDGVIKSKDYESWSTLMASDKTNLFDVSIRKNYKQLFNESDE